MNPQDLLDAFHDTGLHLASFMAPYSLHLLYLLILTEIITIGITWMMGSDDPPELVWRIGRLIFSGGFAWWWLVNAFPLGTSLIGSFDQIGRIIANAPAGLAPSQFFDVGLRIAKILWNSPSSSRMLPDFGFGHPRGNPGRRHSPVPRPASRG